jgi:glycine/D-amino acid oxidase-like deaminating enzyme
MDLMPHAGLRDGVFYAMGYGGHGVALATYLGKKLADRICGKDSSMPLEDLRFWPIPLYQGWPWFLPFAGLYYETLDKIS